MSAPPDWAALCPLALPACCCCLLALPCPCSYVAGEVARCWDARRAGAEAADDARALAEANASAPPAVIEVFSPFSPGSPVSRALRADGFGSPAAARARAKLRAAAAAVTAASSLHANKLPAVGGHREPPYDALHLDPQPGLGLADDAVSFMRFPRAFCCALAAEVPCVEAVAAEDGAALTHHAVASGGGSGGSVTASVLDSLPGAAAADMLAAVMVRTNVSARESSRVSAHLLWLLWRSVLLLYNALSRRAPYGNGAGERSPSRGKAAPPQSSPWAGSGALGSPAGGRFLPSEGRPPPLASPPAGVPTSQSAPPAIAVRAGGRSAGDDGGRERRNERADLSRGGYDRRTLDVHAAVIVYRILEATASAHVFPLG